MKYWFVKRPEDRTGWRDRHSFSPYGWLPATWVATIAGVCMVIGVVLQDGGWFWLGVFMLIVMILTRNTLP